MYLVLLLVAAVAVIHLDHGYLGVLVPVGHIMPPAAPFFREQLLGVLLEHLLLLLGDELLEPL